MINEPSVDVMIRKLGTEEDPVTRFVRLRRNAPVKLSKRRKTQVLPIRWEKTKNCLRRVRTLPTVK